MSDNLHTSYTDILDISYLERVYLIELIKEKWAQQEKALSEMRAKQKNNKQYK